MDYVSLCTSCPAHVSLSRSHRNNFLLSTFALGRKKKRTDKSYEYVRGYVFHVPTLSFRILKSLNQLEDVLAIRMGYDEISASASADALSGFSVLFSPGGLSFLNSDP